MANFPRKNQRPQKRLIQIHAGIRARRDALEAGVYEAGVPEAHEFQAGEVFDESIPQPQTSTPKALRI